MTNLADQKATEAMDADQREKETVERINKYASMVSAEMFIAQIGMLADRPIVEVWDRVHELVCTLSSDDTTGMLATAIVYLTQQGILAQAAMSGILQQVITNDEEDDE
ncbi:MAG TPA: hypothetical protein VIY48_14110 [Candidatus Paceibacterota bacterium]